ncbi:type II toxin-antitoxin system RelE/ParE family toxin [Candidatus Electrothrix sp.]|uniref:type II toxin-antitoxin system RelE/ParE family toxin n=1 Tax=Candidatus Electrothrix sp. TaxID=2170559 RepID=UPI0040573E75
MNSILRTKVFDAWLSKLKDNRGKARIIERIRSAGQGNFGDCRTVGQGVVVYILLCGGTKRGQQRDIAKAIKMTETITAEDYENKEPGTGTL